MRDLLAAPRAASRRDVLGASEVAEVLGLSPWADASPMRVWRRKMADAPPEPETAVHLRGHVLERAVCDWYALTTGHVLQELPGYEHPILHADYAWLAATPDRLVHGPEASWLVEAKTSRARDGWGDEGTDQVPVHYLAQVVVQMAVADCDRADVAVYLPPDEFRVYTVHRDRDVEAELIGRARAWWERHVVGGEPPPLDASDATRAYLLARYPHPLREYRDATPTELTLARELRDVRAAQAAAERREGELRALLCAAIGEDSGLLCGDLGRIDWLARRGSARLDAKALAAAHPDLVREYTRTGEPGRSFTPRFQTEQEDE